MVMVIKTCVVQVVTLTRAQCAQHEKALEAVPHTHRLQGEAPDSPFHFHLEMEVGPSLGATLQGLIGLAVPMTTTSLLPLSGNHQLLPHPKAPPPSACIYEHGSKWEQVSPVIPCQSVRLQRLSGVISEVS